MNNYLESFLNDPTNATWIAIGLIGQGLFFGRFVIQWIASERAKQSIIPKSFWYLSLTGSVILLSYSIYRKDPVFIMGFSVNLLIYTRNLILIKNSSQ